MVISRTESLGDRLVKLLALDGGQLFLHITRLARTVTTSESTRSPGTTTADRIQVGQDAEGLGVSEGHVDDAVVGEGAHGGESSGLLATSLRGSGDEDTGVLAPETTGAPLLAGLVPESLPLSGEVAVSCWDADEEGVILLEHAWVFEDGDICGLRRSVHLGEDLVRKSLGDPRCFTVSMSHDLKGRQLTGRDRQCRQPSRYRLSQPQPTA